MYPILAIKRATHAWPGTGFICDTLTNSCDANDAAKAICGQATAAASAAPPKTGAQADAFNDIFGIQTVSIRAHPSGTVEGMS